MSKTPANSPKSPGFGPKWNRDWATRLLYPEPDFAGQSSSSVKASQVVSSVSLLFKTLGEHVNCTHATD